MSRHTSTPNNSNLYTHLATRAGITNGRRRVFGISSTSMLNHQPLNHSTTYTFKSTGSTLISKGFLEIYPTDTKEVFLPELSEQEKLEAELVEPKQHFTEPPPRYTEASIVKTLEENGIGRPSTYAPTISTVVDRGYVEKEERKLKPTDMAFVVNDLLVANFPEVVDYQFTANMENDLDAIADGEKNGCLFSKTFTIHSTPISKSKKRNFKKDVTEEKLTQCAINAAKPMVIKIGRFGKFLACTGYPECKTTKPIPGSKEDVQAQQAAEQITDENVRLQRAHGYQTRSLRPISRLLKISRMQNH